MIDPERILALAKLPAQRPADRRSAIDRLQVIGGVRPGSSTAAPPVSWPKVQCLAESQETGEERQVGEEKSR